MRKMYTVSILTIILLLIILVSPVYADVTLAPSSGIGFQGSEGGPYSEDHTSQIQQLDGIWGPPTTLVPYNYYATGQSPQFWDALTIKFDTGSYDPSRYKAVLRFYAQKGEYWDTWWHHYILLIGDKNATYQDIDHLEVISDPNFHSIGNTGGSWFEETLEDSYWSSGSFWITLRLWNARIDTVELLLIPRENPCGSLPVVPLPGYSTMPTDPDGDCIYEDLNANGRLDFADVVLYFNQMTWIAANEPVNAFDLNGNGRIDFADIVALFNEI